MPALPFAGTMDDVQPRCVIVDDDNGFIDVAETPLLGKPINLKTLLSTVEGVLAPRDK